MKPIILCCGQNGSGLVFGYVEEHPEPGEAVKLHNARMIISYPSGGTFGLAAKGPPPNSHVTHAVPSTLETVWQEYLECTPEAAKVFDGWCDE